MINSKHGSIFHRFRDMASFLLKNVHFPTISIQPIFENVSFLLDHWNFARSSLRHIANYSNYSIAVARQKIKRQWMRLTLVRGRVERPVLQRCWRHLASNVCCRSDTSERRWRRSRTGPGRTGAPRTGWSYVVPAHSTYDCWTRTATNWEKIDNRSKF